ncbi:hypothetical protein ACFFMR_22610 [Micromonospora andamanensis]|uniref:DUF4333 domain-containing protein n=1 Tax=Micromonospora andamanensis TaxID=1287068 RepID=A0ABQ4HXU6_9ACTN|nr:hypothetical protein [Micromonospora andamanensis]GIJ10456.1 hypothetical protein Van01_36700 [Micromonospora andamanensis]
MSVGMSSRSRPRIALVAVATTAVVCLIAWALTAARGNQPSGVQEVASEGVRISVPAAWSRNAIECGTPVRDTYVVDVQAVAGCALTPAPRVDYAEIRLSADLALDPAATIATEERQIAGRNAHRGGDVLPDGRARRVVVVERRVVVIAVSEDPAVADAIADSVKID